MSEHDLKISWFPQPIPWVPSSQTPHEFPEKKNQNPLLFIEIVLLISILKYVFW